MFVSASITPQVVPDDQDVSASSTNTVLSKAALILDALGELGVAGVSSLSRRTKLAKTTTARIAGELVVVGLVERSGDGYCLASKMFELGSRVPGRRYLRDAALPFLEDLSYATKQTVHLAVLDQGDVFYVERLVGNRSGEVPSSVADRLPLHCTATGKCILAFGPTDLLGAMLSAPLESLTPKSISDTTVLMRELANVRASGAAVERGEVANGLRSVAAPIRGHQGTLVGALSATGPDDEYDEEKVEPLVRLAAAGLSHRLGYV